MSFRRSIEDIVESLRDPPLRGRGCSLLIGAGCSVEGGIPDAAGFVEIIEQRYPQAFRRASEKTYPQCMAELTLGERRELVAEYVDKAKINWAHIGIACLMKHGYVDHVLTTNFDPLVMRACALLGELPAVYDFAASQFLSLADVPDRAVFHLHGQRTGFVLMNTKAACERHSRRLGPVFQDAGQGRVWIVVGYSGENDPVFDQLAKVDRFDNGLFWVGYKDSGPAPHLREKLLVEGKDAFFTEGWDADSFFVTLTQKLGIFPPSLVQHPFTHLDGTFEMLAPFHLPMEFTDAPQEELTATPRKWIRRAIADFEPCIRTAVGAVGMLVAGDYEGIFALAKEHSGPLPPELAHALAWSYIAQGNALSDHAKAQTGEEAGRLYTLAGESYAAALASKPDKHEALNNWGVALSDHAKTQTGEEADRLYSLAGEKYAAALAIKPDKHEALNNWGVALSDHAKTRTGEAADRLYSLAGEKYAAALAIKPDKQEALYNWGVALAAQAKTKKEELAARLYRLAGEKYAAALAIKPDKHEALYNWGVALAAQAKTKTEELAARLYRRAGQKYPAALAIRPDKHEALNNWGVALSDRAEIKAGEEVDDLYRRAGEKFAAALAIKPDEQEALNNWALALLGQAKIKTGEDARRCLGDAREKLRRAEEIKPGAGAYNLACLGSFMRNEPDCRRWLETSREAGTLPRYEYVLADAELNFFRQREWFKEFLQRAYPGQAPPSQA